MSVDVLQSGEEALLHARLALGETDLHRLDLAARLLACKQPQLAAETLLIEAASELAREGGGERNVFTATAVLVRLSAILVSRDGPERDAYAARRLAALAERLDDPADLAALQGLVRRGGFERAPSLAQARRLRRACKRLPPDDPERPAEGGGTAAALDELLEALARSLALDRDPEITADLELEPGDSALRLLAVRSALHHGLQLPPDPTRATLVSGGPVSAKTLSTGPRPAAPDRLPFEAGQTIGRFTILGRLGAGAMGIVYAAYDPELDRRIALKVLRAQQRSRGGPARLLREAQAMARLSHPNVAVVHDVGTHEGDVFVAMEFIRGVTLQAWIAERTRPWQEVVEAFLQAGRGLAAAHAAGLVHRDFKPTNAMMGADGRVRVLDFGLCSTGAGVEVTDDPEAPLQPRKRELIGTPAYMSTEQFLGEPVGPASDQFSFCVSLYEGLYRRLPFAGETLKQIAWAVARGEVQPPPRGVRAPSWLHAAVLRGLQPDPKDRFSSMEELLRALERGRGRGRWSAAAALALAGATGLGGYWGAHAGAPPVDACSGGAQEIAEVWNAERRAAGEGAFAALGPAYAAEVWPGVAGALDRYADAWQSMHRASCEAHRRGENSDALLDRRMACLAQRKAALAGAADVFADADAGVGLRALEVVGALPDLARCADIPALEAEVPPPDDPHVRARVQALRPRFERVRALERAGRQSAAVGMSDELVREAEAIGDRPALAEALLLRGQLVINLGERIEDTHLTRAYLTALGARADEVAAEALALRLYVRGRSPGKLERALEDLDVARELVARLPSPGRVRGLLLNNAGAVMLSAGDVLAAERTLREALAVKEAELGAHHREVAYTLSNLAMVVTGDDEREALVRRALRIFEVELGPAHPHTAEVRIAASAYTPDPRAARDLLVGGCATLERFAPDSHAQQVVCRMHLGDHAAEAGDLDTARDAFARAAELAPRLPREITELRDQAAQARGYAALLGGPREGVHDELRAAIAAHAKADEWWERRQRADLNLCLGLLLAARGPQDEARAALERALADYAETDDKGRDFFLPRRIARTRLALADVLLRAPAGSDDTTRAAALLALAEGWYRGAGEAFAWRLPEIAALHRRSNDATLDHL